MKLYEINQALAERLTALGEMLENGNTPSQATIDELLDLKSDLTNKLVNYGKFIKNTQSDIDGLDGEIKRLTAKKRALQNRTEILKENMRVAMLTHDIDKIDDPIMPIRLQNNSKASINIVDVNALPTEFKLIKVEANKSALEMALKNGIVIEGVSMEKGKHIRIG